MIFKHTVVAFLALVVVQIYGQATITCTYTDPSTKYQYDLTPLVSNNADYIVDVPTGTDAQTVTVTFDQKLKSSFEFDE